MKKWIIGVSAFFMSCAALAATHTNPDVWTVRDMAQALLTIVFLMVAAYMTAVVRRIDKQEESIDSQQKIINNIHMTLLGEYQRRNETMAHFDRIEKAIQSIADKGERNTRELMGRIDQIIQRNHNGD